LRPNHHKNGLAFGDLLGEVVHKIHTGRDIVDIHKDFFFGQIFAQPGIQTVHGMLATRTSVGNKNLGHGHIPALCAFTHSES
jgi:hypothetical protein